MEYFAIHREFVALKKKAETIADGNNGIHTEWKKKNKPKAKEMKFKNSRFVSSLFILDGGQNISASQPL